MAVQLTKPILIGLAIILLIVGITSVNKACKLTDKVSYLGGELKILRQEAATLKKDKLAEIAKAEQTKKDMDKIVKAKDTDIARKTEIINHLTGTIGQLDDALAVAKTDAERVIILTAQVKQWSDKFTLAEGIIADKDDVIFSLNAKYEAQVKISNNWKALFDTEITKSKIQEDLSSALKRDLRLCRLGGRVKSGLVIAGVAAVVYFVAAK